MRGGLVSEVDVTSIYLTNVILTKTAMQISQQVITIKMFIRTARIVIDNLVEL